ncbi:MAG: hypothetical protein CMM76_04555 [Rhodospirillaceae bacterium]|nr:hypothetical protein [Rhodospirillaceae bacterium]
MERPTAIVTGGVIAQMLASSDDDVAFTFRCEADAAALEPSEVKKLERHSLAIKAGCSDETGSAICWITLEEKSFIT